MNAANKPITATTSLSIMLHCIAIAAIALVYEQVAVTGSGIEIQLISSTEASDQRETEAASKRSNTASKVEATQQRVTESDHAQDSIPQDIRRPVERAQSMASSIPVQREVGATIAAENMPPSQQDGNSTAQVARSTNAAHQKHSMIELLHARISETKEYPYIARRQRREGIATVGFVLNPDGSIENTRLVASSNAGALDRAALTAVHRIEPFKPAQTYLDQPEAFQVDVVFDLL